MLKDPESNKLDMNFSDQNFSDKTLSRKALFFMWIEITLLLIPYIIIAIVLIAEITSPYISGVIAQFQVMISVYLTVRFKKSGYVTAVIINTLQGLASAIGIFLGNINASTGVFIAITTIITLSIILSFENRLDKKIQEVSIKNAKLAVLNENIATAHEEMEQQNELLMTYNRIIKENEKNLSYQAFFDMLTGLPNRNVLLNRLDDLVASPENENIRFAVTFIDLDNFKQVNDTMGHHIGDILLQAVALKLNKAIHPDDMLGRLGGDEFALIIQRSLSNEEIVEYVESLMLSLMENIVLENNTLFVSASFGVAFYPQDGRSTTELLKHADTAMYKSKASKKNPISFENKEVTLQVDFA